MAQAQIGDTVKLHYAGKLQDGTEFDSSMNREPLEFKIGDWQLIPGFENAVIGMAPGETKTATIESSEAYGPRREDMVVEVQRQQLPADLELEVGQHLNMRDQEGESLLVKITNVTEDTVTLDANHPLAGQDLIFEIQLLEIL